MSGWLSDCGEDHDEIRREGVVVTDEMVDLVLEPLHARHALVGRDYADVRVALEAALTE